MSQVLERVDVGEQITVTKVNYAGDVSTNPSPWKRKAEAKCEHNTGYWICATHKMTFTNQFCKDTHIGSGKHRLAWFCLECNSVQVP